MRLCHCSGSGGKRQRSITVITLITILCVCFAFLLVILASWLLLHKTRGVIRQREHDEQRQLFLGELPPLLLDEPPDQAERTWESWQRAVTPAIREMNRRFRSGMRRRRHTARKAAWEVLAELSETVTGETHRRITYIFERLGFVQEDLSRLADRRWWIRGEAASHLGIMRSRLGVLPLVVLLHDPERDVRSAATQSLIDIAGVKGALQSILQNLAAITPWIEVHLAKRILAAGDAAIGPLLSSLDNHSGSVRMFAIKMLGELRSTEAIGPLYARFLRMDDPTKQLALVTLGKSGDERTLDLLEISIESEDEGIRCAAIAGLGHLGAPSAVPRLTIMLSDTRLPVQKAAGEALMRILPAGKTALEEVARREEGVPRAVAMHYLDLLAMQEESR
jgi:HEAT repeat protein